MIRKTSETRPLAGNIVNAYNESQTSAYSCDYINGTVLYENGSGTAGNTTLSDSIANYRYIEIYYKTNDGSEYTSSQKMQVSGQTIKTFLSYDHLYANINYTKIAEVSLNGTSLVFESNYQTDNGGSPTTGTYIYVTKVIGYK